LPLLAAKYAFDVDRVKIKEAFIVKYEAEEEAREEVREEVRGEVREEVGEVRTGAGTGDAGKGEAGKGVAGKGVAGAGAGAGEVVGRQQALPLHRDSSLLSFVVSLSPPRMRTGAGGGAGDGGGADAFEAYERGYEGGGTRFQALNTTLGLEQGEALLFSGKLAHEVWHPAYGTLHVMAPCM
jgi:hypothetical protein